MSGPNWTPPTQEQIEAEALAGKARAIRAEVDRLRATIDPARFIALAASMTYGTQADLARLSGLTANTITAIKQGKRPTAAQRAAIYWAIAEAQGL